MRDHCQGIEGATTGAAESILTAIEGMTTLAESDFRRASRNPKEFIRKSARFCIDAMRTRWARLLNSVGFAVDKAAINRHKYASKKQPKLDRKRIEVLHQEIFGHPTDFYINEIESGIFLIHR